MYRIRTLVPALAVMLALGSAPAIAVDSDPAPAANADLDAGRKAIQAKDWNAALKSLAAAERREPRNATVHVSFPCHLMFASPSVISMFVPQGSLMNAIARLSASTLRYDTVSGMPSASSFFVNASRFFTSKPM